MDILIRTLSKRWPSISRVVVTSLRLNPCRPTAELFVRIFHSFEAGIAFKLMKNRHLPN